MRRISVFALLAVLGAIPATLAQAPADPACQDDMVFEDVLNRSLSSGVTDAKDIVIRNENQWCDFWEELHSRIFPQPECDTSLIDFTEEVAIVSALGARPNTCYGVSIYCVDDETQGNSSLRVFVRDVVPGPNCACGLAIVHPVNVIKVSKPVGQVSFIHETSVLDCAD